ncbi:MAG: FHA domain-containing protein [Deltaproteobacteria bacterium]|nr:FHA domain-containing protein [Deltaproteobacteria bacterium]MDQ3299673.1 FHA domain-containing protein [Myxococcota bacterium]
MARLLWRDAQGIEGSLDLASAEIKVGRAMDCAIRTDDAMVSRHHARIFWGGGGYVLEDLQSANGCYFQEQRVQSHLFKHGDAVRCGSLWLRFVDLAGVAAPAPAPAGGPAPMMQHPGMGAIAPIGPTGHVGALPNTPGMNQAPQPNQPAISQGPSESDVEIRVLRRRVEQLQTELRVYRANKFNQDTARRMEDLEADLSTIEIERDSLKTRLERAETQMTQEAGSVKVRRALEIAAMTAETASSLNDLLSSLRIEVMAAEGEFEQYAHNIPRASYELIRQSLKEAAGRCDEAREALRKLREVAD